MEISFAPLQGYTDYVYRQIFSRHFEGIDSFYAPYISPKDLQKKSHPLRDLLPENNEKVKLVPQILAGTPEELKELAASIAQLGYTHINLNMGCPYPMVTRRHRGAGLLAEPDRLKAILDAIGELKEIQISIKTRLGLLSMDEFDPILPLLNQSPIKTLILHPRTAQQLYKGDANTNAFIHAAQMSQHPVIYNGDIRSSQQVQELIAGYPKLKGLMLGRGLLSNPFLAGELKYTLSMNATAKKASLQDFHDDLLEAQAARLSGNAHILGKMRPHWEYLSCHFSHSHKVYKAIKKARSVTDYKAAVHAIFRNEDWLI